MNKKRKRKIYVLLDEIHRIVWRGRSYTALAVSDLIDEIIVILEESEKV